MLRASISLRVYIQNSSGSWVNHPENVNHPDPRAGREQAASQVEAVGYLKHKKRLLKYSQSTPYITQDWGIFIAGGHPQTPGSKYPAPLFQWSLKDWNEA